MGRGGLVRIGSRIYSHKPLLPYSLPPRPPLFISEFGLKVGAENSSERTKGAPASGPLAPRLSGERRREGCVFRMPLVPARF